MTDTVDQQSAYLGMSDEDIANMTEPVETPAAVTEPVPPEGATAPAEEPAAVVEPEVDGSAEAAAAGGDQPTGEAGEGVTAPVQGGSEGAPEASATEKAPVTEKTEPATNAVDFEAEYKRLLAPFKANGREVAVGSVDDAIALMQMGANYNKKMAALKPNLRLMKLLENNNLLSEERLSFLIELDKKSPDAINKLVKDSGLNPMDFDAEKAGEYKPKIHSVDEREMALDTVLEEIQETPTYNQTLEIVSKRWDGASKQVIAEAPQLLKVINDHVERGIYGLINAEMERERMLGRLNGLSDIEAYQKVGDAIQARGGFNHLGSSQGKTSTKPLVVVAPKPVVVDDGKLNDKRRAASATKPATPAPAAPGKEFNPLALSDEEFAKVADGRFR